MEVLNFDLQFGLGGGAFAQVNQFATDKFGGSSWISITQDVRSSEPIVVEYGIQGNDPSDCIANTGTCTFALNNGAWNTAGILGFYSPLHAEARGGFNFNIPTRLVITQANGTPYYKFYGRLADILVTPGAHEDRLVHCTAVDLMDDWARMPVPSLPTQFNKRGDELLQQIINALPPEVQPPVSSVEVGLGTYPIALDQAHEDAITVREAIQQICISELGRGYFVGTSASPGGLFVFRNRQATARNPVVMHTFDNDMARGGLAVPGSRDDLVSQVQVFFHPTVVDPEPTTVLYSIGETQTSIGPGQTYPSLFGPYRDAQNRGESQYVGGTDMQPPEPYTDYTMNMAADGSSGDLTPYFTVEASYDGAGGVSYPAITNNGPVSGFITKMQARGKGIYRTTSVAKQDVPVEFGQRAIQVDMTYLTSGNVAEDVASYLRNIYSRPLQRVSSVTFLANLDPSSMSVATILEPGSRIAISEDVTGIESAEFIINAVRLQIVQAAETDLLWCTWTLQPADTQRYWLIGVPGASEIGVNTVVGF